ncbi:argininosuccinate lyase [Clostridium saccharobutylicum]|uniref:Argininosuccinate lyase n=1 Tax=Clostridium saccharobutylicum DSM 13864 TaxID=1345695 RepID=U5MQL8_CLOSA|nr:argininosuccinate lyase [Clostridium saccharobutylicum]AGX41732.1 argininosuccinate lyase ArgH [Clostridium saccharobutylicum DSM 13864]AQR89011.1 argininosuccinate lyase 1 [Clostridium saccharobutylicum]AQR98912.1 argininosuccinate lyase 1 [Clostridium saccharobutylicum]AQS12900.1 argininosuccinate lyase 1 [Clostridium saccharobutylicum]MBA2903983.1 argininosuccinate lyase [Clostridium saccharobutylicum]
MKLWGGRFKKGTDKLVNDFNSSINVDSRMYKEDIEGSLAHASMLGKQNIIPKEASQKITSGLLEILKRLDSGAIEIDETSEDIHSFVEGTLTYYIGECGKMVHTGRSRNDQVTLDLRLYLKKYILSLKQDIIALEEVLLEKANENIDTIMPGYTHMQKAQPITFAHHILAYAEMLKRDFGRLSDCYKRVDEMPLGSGALATSTYPIDREAVARDLGFSKVTLNSLDSVSDRDYVIETLSCLSIIMMHLSRFSEEIILWCTNEFSFIELDDGYSTGSSIMPQKKNPDVAELVRGKTGRVYGDLITLLTVMKGIPLAYNKDMQEDKEALFDGLDTVTLSLKTFCGMIKTMKVKKDNMRKGAGLGFTNATDVADYLVKKGMAFRNAHEVVGEIVLDCIKQNKMIEELTIEELKNFSPIFEDDIYHAIDLLTCVEERKVIGGPSTQSVKMQISALDNFIKEFKENI